MALLTWTLLPELEGWGGGGEGVQESARKMLECLFHFRVMSTEIVFLTLLQTKILLFYPISSIIYSNFKTQFGDDRGLR